MLKKLFIALLIASPSWATFSGYTYRKTITIPTSKVGTSAGLTQSNFPALVSLNDNSLSTTTTSGGRLNSSGMDLIFSTMSDCSFKLFWDTETVQNVGVSAMNVWVNIPTLSTTTDVSATFFMCYGNSSITTWQGGSTGSVYDANYKSIWHVPGITANDSTNNANTGTVTAVSATTGQIDGGGSFDGASSFILGNKILNSANQTVSVWVSITAYPVGGTGYLIGSSQGIGSPTDDHIITLDTTGHAAYYIFDGGTKTTTPSGVLATGVWTYLVGTNDGTHSFIYVNGVQVGSILSGTGFSSYVSANMMLGGESSFIPKYVQALFDEARWSNIARSADWILTEYNNQSSPSTFIIVSGETIDYSGVNRGLNIQGGKLNIQGGKVTVQ